MAFKLIAGDKLAQFEAALKANGLNMNDEIASGFAGLQNIKAAALSDARGEVAQEIAGLQEVIESASTEAAGKVAEAESKASEAEARANEAESKAKGATTEALKAERETPNIPSANGDYIDHKAAWKAMPSATDEQRKAKAKYFKDFVSKTK